MQAIDAKVPNKVHLQIKNKINKKADDKKTAEKSKTKEEVPTNNENIEQQEADMNPKNDDIATSSTDDMFAFS